LALFYTLKDLGKNVNLIIETLPENLKFLTPSLDFISYPKNFVISIPNKVAGISQVFYEKNDEALKIHLTLENGNIKKENIAFYFAEAKPDLIITLGIKDYSQELSDKLNSFGFLLDSPILNIDNVKENKKFGKINLLEDFSLTEIIFNLTKDLNAGLIKKELATCLLSGIVIETENFKKNITAEIFEIAGGLMKNGADLKQIINNIYK
jgi:nanoRNase/pAp phosphatase (c-di-AMP/oligoRNAs hydrolase)